MKKLLLLLLFTNIIYAQTPRVQQDLNNFEPGRIIIKLKDNVDTKTTYNSKGKGTSQVNIGQLLGIESKVKTTTVLFTEKTILKSVVRKQQKSVDYRVPNPHTLKNIFILELTNEAENIFDLIEELNKNDKVEYVEPDYNLSINDFTIDSEIIYPTSILKTTSISNTPNDPLYSQQTNITAVKIDSVWSKYTTGDGSQIIAILDTGVDYTHPDLEANIWINEAELNGVDDFDDDGNGYIDDIRGWDFINVDNAPLDDNMHGTHVAGIAGAVGNNGIGIAGAAWNVKLMPIKVFQSNGVGNASTIAEGVTYASENGATILNMSFGSYAESITMRNALENAYATSVLVAAAGNDAFIIGYPGVAIGAYYPAAYSFVIGVESSDPYSNYDQDGPLFSEYSNLLNYETTAPGLSILSTVPNGGYRSLTGTSMSSPLVSGGVALYLKQKPTDSKELLFGNLINTSASYVDVLSAIEVIPLPELKVLSAVIMDTINSQNGNSYIEPNETIEIFPFVKNYWGSTDDVRVGIEFAEFEDQSKATILEGEIAVGSISAYATLHDLTQSLKIKIADGVANNVNIKFNLKVWSGPDMEYLTSIEYIINVKNSILLIGNITQDMTLYPDKEYFVPDNVVFSESATITIKPGTKIIFRGGTIQYSGAAMDFWNSAKIIAIGTKDSLITFKSDNFGIIRANINVLSTFQYCVFDDVSINGHADISHSQLINGSSVKQLSSANVSTINTLKYSNVINPKNGYFNQSLSAPNTQYNNYQGGASYVNIEDVSTAIKSNYINNGSTGFFHQNVGQNVELEDIYLGTAKDEIIDRMNPNYFDSPSFGFWNFSNTPKVPYPETHGIVWKVLVNDKDAQDEYDVMDPIGVGVHTFDVYFNREMDTTKPPQVSYGVREPYNQKIISEEGTWSADGKVYTVTHEVKIGAADGINRIRVQGARDLDWFEIPVDNKRFNMLVQSAGSASTGFAATPGLGEITLEWEAPDATLLEDVLGYNMYRYEAITDTTFTASTKINTALITDPQLVDFNVEEGTRYYYQYKILRTSFEETDFSSVVSTAPLTSTLGDSNGDFAVNVMDLVQNVDYILGNNPSPFIFVAGDVNNDQAINVLDIVGTVDIILNPTSGKTATKGANSINYYSNTPVEDAIFSWEGNDLFVTSNYDIGGIQLAFNQDFEYTLSDNLPGVERLNYTQDDAAILMLYSFNNTVIANTKTKILTRADASQEFDINLAVVGTTNGEKLNAVLNNSTLGTIDAPFQSNKLELLNLYPNPSDGILNLQYYLPELMDVVTVKVYDIQGRLVWAKNIENQVGKTDRQLNLDALKAGNYILLMSAHKDGGVKYLSHQMLILK